MYQYLNESQKKWLFNGILALVVLLAIFVGIKAIVSLKEYRNLGRGTYPSNVISVIGKGEIVTVPDTGMFTYSVLEEGKTVAEAQDKASKKGNAIIAALKTLGIEEKDIQTTGYNSYPKYDYTTGQICIDGSYCRGGKQVLTGYEVNQSVTVKIRKTADAGAALTKVGELGASNISSLNFVVDDMDAAQAEARAKAITDAREKAKVLAKSLGVSLGDIISFYENGGNPYPMYNTAMAGGVMMDKAMSLQSATPPTLPVGENKVTSEVTITYEIK